MPISLLSQAWRSVVPAHFAAPVAHGLGACASGRFFSSGVVHHQNSDSAHHYQPQHPIRVVTAAARFDGHDASINIMRRVLTEAGAEVIHLGHNRGVRDIVTAAVQEDAQAIALSSYQGGHMEFFSYMLKLLKDMGAGHIKIFGGGGGVIVPKEVDQLHAEGVAKIFTPSDGRELGLRGMIDHIMEGSDYLTTERWGATADVKLEHLTHTSWPAIARHISAAEHAAVHGQSSHVAPCPASRRAPVIGFTGTGGAGKSSLVDELVRRFRRAYPDKSVAVLCIDPSRRRTGGALLGDRIRMNAVVESLGDQSVYVRSLATRHAVTHPEANSRDGNDAKMKSSAEHASTTLSTATQDALEVLQWSGHDLIFLETPGIGQGDSAVTDLVDTSVYVMTAEYGAPSQLEKIEMLDAADFVVLNKADHHGAEDALREIRRQVMRNRGTSVYGSASHFDDINVFPTVSSLFNNEGVNRFFNRLMGHVAESSQGDRILPRSQSPEGGPDDDDDDGSIEGAIDPESERNLVLDALQHTHIIPEESSRHLADVARVVRGYHARMKQQGGIASRLQSVRNAKQALLNSDGGSVGSSDSGSVSDDSLSLGVLESSLEDQLSEDATSILAQWADTAKQYSGETYEYVVRDKTLSRPLVSKTLAGTRLPKVVLPHFDDDGQLLQWLGKENLPGHFPYTSGVFPLRRDEEDPTRMFAGEGSPAKTNKRFHLLASGGRGNRLSTAFDAVTLYGEDPAEEADIFGKIGESGVSICTVEDMETLYAGFDLCDPSTSVSMTINGPAPIMLSFFLNTAIRQQMRKFLFTNDRMKLGSIDECWEPMAGGMCVCEDEDGGHSYESLRNMMSDDEYVAVRSDTFARVRGTVQADILKEDQGQNTCIFSTEFALKLMGDIQEYFIGNNVRNYYSVSISGYHIAEAGANPITQLALTLANGFTYVEYYRQRGMDVNAFAPNLSFFFSNGLDAEYSVIGRVARRIWAVAMRDLYGANARSQMLKYHIQTSGRSLHSQDIAFNDIRTTLQAMQAVFDNANSLHTNAYDEAITTPTEESVRRALAIQLILTRELGLSKCENPWQGSFALEWLTDQVEEAVLQQFEQIAKRGGVLGAMELGYQRSQIQDESMYYEALKHEGSLPIVGVNTFIDPKTLSDDYVPAENELRRATIEEKMGQLNHVRDFQSRYADQCPDALAELSSVAEDGGNTFEALLHCGECCSLGQITHALYDVGGQYRRSM